MSLSSVNHSIYHLPMSGGILLPPHRLVRRLFQSSPVRGLLLYLSALVYFVVEVVQQLSKKVWDSILALDQRKET